MNVVEIFESIQGEGAFMGQYCTFVRFAGCNLQCPFCDEHHKYGMAKDMSVEDIVNQVKTPHVVLTGGEPTLQPQFEQLCTALSMAHHYVHIETNGTKYIAPKQRNLWVTCSPKAPDFKVATPYHEMKLVVDPSLTIEKAYSLWNKCTPIWLQPCDGPYIEDSKRKIIKWVKQHPEAFRAGIQLHKYYGII